MYPRHVSATQRRQDRLHGTSRPGRRSALKTIARGAHGPCTPRPKSARGRTATAAAASEPAIEETQQSEGDELMDIAEERGRHESDSQALAPNGVLDGDWRRRCIPPATTSRSGPICVASPLVSVFGPSTILATVLGCGSAAHRPTPEATGKAPLAAPGEPVDTNPTGWWWYVGQTPSQCGGFLHCRPRPAPPRDLDREPSRGADMARSCVPRRRRSSMRESYGSHSQRQSRALITEEINP
jgi:hypothetical protein